MVTGTPLVPVAILIPLPVSPDNMETPPEAPQAHEVRDQKGSQGKEASGDQRPRVGAAKP